MQGTVEAIYLRPDRNVPAIAVNSVVAAAAKGLEGDHHTKGGNRQVTLLSQEAWDSICQEFNTSIDPILRRANILISGMDFKETVGRLINVGPVVIRILGETMPCRLMDEVYPGLKEALSKDWRGGAYGEILNSETISINDKVTWQT